MSAEFDKKGKRKRTKNLIEKHDKSEPEDQPTLNRKTRHQRKRDCGDKTTTTDSSNHFPFLSKGKFSKFSSEKLKTFELDCKIKRVEKPKSKTELRARDQASQSYLEVRKNQFCSRKSPTKVSFDHKKRNEKGRKGDKKWQRLNDMASCSSGEVPQNGKNVSYFSRHPVFRNEKTKQVNHHHKNHHKRCSTHLPMEEDSPSSDTGMPELPGFYYDREKKKYFKILPNDSCIGNAVTHASIQIKEKERTRKSDLLSTSHLRKSVQNKKSCWSSLSNSVPCLSCHLQQGIISPQKMSLSLHKLRLKNIQKTPQTHIKLYPNHRRSLFEQLDYVSQLEMNENKRIVGLFSYKDSMVQRIIWMKLKEKEREKVSDRLSLSVDPSPDYGFYQSAIKISSMHLIDSDSILYTGMVYTGTPESLVFMKGFGEGSSRYAVYSIGQKATWTCAWNKHANQFSVGSEKCGLLLDVQTRRLWEINTHNSDVLCQVFSKQNGNCLFSGTRKNQIFTHDLRSISTYSVNQLTMSSSVCGLQLLKNDIHLLASDVKGKVALWDLRMNKIVTDYYGQKNEYLKIPIHVDEYEDFVYGADQDGYIRLWCLHTGDLLKTIPPPQATSYDFFPSVLYSRNWLDVSGNAGLLMGLGDKIYVYSDYQDLA